MRLALKAIVAAVILVLSLAAPVAAGPFEDATAAYAAYVRHMQPSKLVTPDHRFSISKIARLPLM